MGNPFKCYICDIETNSRSSKNIANTESEHSKRPIAEILKRLHNVDGRIRAHDGSNICVLCEDCIDKMNAYDAACLLVKQVEYELKAIISRTEKRYRNGTDPIEIIQPEQLNTIVKQYASDDDLRSDSNYDHNDGHDADISHTSELGMVTDTEEEDFDSDDSFVWPKNRASKRKREESAQIEKKKRRLYRCIECPADYYNVDDMQLHLASHKSPQFRCGLCHMRLTKGRESDGHEDLHLNRPPLQCIFCDEHFESKLPLVQHVEMHNGGMNALCYICGLIITAKNLDSRHIKVHLGILDYECSHCSRKFVDTKQLNRHLKTHTGGSLPHACPEPGCGKYFKIAANLKMHSYTHNQGLQRPPETLHTCKICGKSYKRPKQLNDHYYKDHDLMQMGAFSSGCSALR